MSVNLPLWEQGERSNEKNKTIKREAKRYFRFIGWALYCMLCNQHHEQGTHICVTEQEQQRNKHLAAQALKQQNRAPGIELELNGSSTQNKDRPLNPGRTNKEISTPQSNMLIS